MTTKAQTIARLRVALEWQRAEATRQANNLPPEWKGTVVQDLRFLAHTARTALEENP